MVLNIGPQHPSTHGVLRLRLVLDGERIVAAEPVIGYMHRGAEKLFEARDYRQIIVLANRHDWLSAFSNELGVVLAVERMLGMEVPMRAVWTRTLLAELNRVLNHLMFLGSYPLELGAITPIFYAFREREDAPGTSWRRSPAAGCTTCSTGSAASRRTCRPAGSAARAAAVAAVRAPHARHRRPGPAATRSSAARTRGVGVLVARAVHAVRRERADRARLGRRLRPAPRRALPRLRRAADVCRWSPATEGDCLARFECLLEQVHVSLDLADACLDRLPSCRPARSTCGCRRSSRRPRATRTRGPRTRSASTATTWSREGEKTPWRLKLRSASYNNIQVLPELLPGTLVADMVAILGSMFFVVGDIDK